MSLPALLQINKAESWPEDRRGWPSYGGKKATGKKAIGFCWYSEENKSPRRIRSLSSPKASVIVSRLRQSGAEIHSLVPGQSIPGLTYIPERIAGWPATYYYISQMDFVLTVDTAVAHLAGLLGVPTLCLLPLNVDWKWGMTGDTSFWYGPQFKLFRNQHPVTWNTDTIMQRVLELLAL
jgi:ADP-heptose:LPS heptosyltransferase